jgi:cobalt-zinc-cadmium efflux system membrane fusion protein
VSTESSVTLPRGAAILTAVALLFAGGGVTFLLMKGAPPRAPVPTPASTSAPASGSADTAPLADLEIRLTPDAVKRAGIAVTPAVSASSTSDLRLPGVIAPNGYRQVTVTPLVSGRVTSVSAELGARVRRGDTVARIYSPELAEAQTRYVSAVAMLDAHDRELQRTRELLDVGAASRQELERIHAVHTAQTGVVQSARARLELLGVTASSLDNATARELSATTAVPAPIDGIVTERHANVGLNVDPSTTLLTVVDLSNVWVLADVHERDLAGVRIGNKAAIVSDADAAKVRHGRVSYLDPQLNPATRTAKARIELPNPSGELRLGMYVDVVITRAAAGPITMIPRSAVQNVGGRTAVYVADANDSGRFFEREVRLGQVSGDRVEVTAGVRPGDLVVSTGSFFVRAERERLGRRGRT